MNPGCFVLIVLLRSCGCLCSVSFPDGAFRGGGGGGGGSIFRRLGTFFLF